MLHPIPQRPGPWRLLMTPQLTSPLPRPPTSVQSSPPTSSSSHTTLAPLFSGGSHAHQHSSLWSFLSRSFWLGISATEQASGSTPQHQWFCGLLIASFVYLLRLSEAVGFCGISLYPALPPSRLSNGTEPLHGGRQHPLLTPILPTTTLTSPCTRAISSCHLTIALQVLPSPTVHVAQSLPRRSCYRRSCGTTTAQLSHCGRWYARCYFNIEQSLRLPQHLFTLLDDRHLYFLLHKRIKSQ